MSVDTIREYYAYTRWANGRVLDCAEQLSEEQVHHSDGPANWSIRDLLVHVMSGQERWLSRWQGRQGGPEPPLLDPTGFPDIASIRARWAQVDADTEKFLVGLTEDDLSREVSYHNLQGKPLTHRLGQQLMHQANHATYHRGEIAALLTRFGASPGEIDYLRYVEATRE